ncbi:MAG: hypothetical protein ACJ788_08045, partial [Ktedonobacteraceae bacterium]
PASWRNVAKAFSKTVSLSSCVAIELCLSLKCLVYRSVPLYPKMTCLAILKCVSGYWQAIQVG